jgi:5-methylthioadenosine/S-adenosylhomocysteine deaminase
MLCGEGPFAAALRNRGITWEAPGISTVKYFEKLGVLESKPLLVHCVTVDPGDIASMAKHGARVAHCPTSNAKLGHGVAPLREMLSKRLMVGLGTDSVASNNRLDLISEARMCCLLHRACDGDSAEPSAESVLRMATLDGARALGLDDRIGSLEVGKEADLIAISLAGSHCAPVHDAAATIVFSSTPGDVVLTVVAGQVLFEEDKVPHVSEHELQKRIEGML